MQFTVVGREVDNVTPPVSYGYLRTRDTCLYCALCSGTGVLKVIGPFLALWDQRLSAIDVIQLHRSINNSLSSIALGSLMRS